MKKTEENLHKQICQYIKIQYKNVIFNTDLSGIKISISQAKKLKHLRSSRAFPDIAIYEPKGGYCGLFIEVKKETPFKKDGSLKSQKVTNKKGESYDHLREQSNMIQKLSTKGYCTDFVWNFEQAKKIIDGYLN